MAVLEVAFFDALHFELNFLFKHPLVDFLSLGGYLLLVLSLGDLLVDCCHLLLDITDTGGELLQHFVVLYLFTHMESCDDVLYQLGVSEGIVLQVPVVHDES